MSFDDPFENEDPFANQSGFIDSPENQFESHSNENIENPFVRRNGAHIDEENEENENENESTRDPFSQNIHHDHHQLRPIHTINIQNEEFLFRDAAENPFGNPFEDMAMVHNQSELEEDPLSLNPFRNNTHHQRNEDIIGKQDNLSYEQILLNSISHLNHSSHRENNGENNSNSNNLTDSERRMILDQLRIFQIPIQNEEEVFRRYLELNRNSLRTIIYFLGNH